MAHLDRSPSLTWPADSGVYARPKPDRRRFYRELLPTPLDATACRVLSPTAITLLGCETAGEALAQTRRLESDIAAAKADGWA